MLNILDQNGEKATGKPDYTYGDNGIWIRRKQTALGIRFGAYIQLTNGDSYDPDAYFSTEAAAVSSAEDRIDRLAAPAGLDRFDGRDSNDPQDR